MTIPWDMPPYEDEIGTDGSDSSNGAAAPDTPPMPTADQLNIPPEAWGIRQMLPHFKAPDQIDDSGWDEVATANATRVDELHNNYLDQQHELLHAGTDALFNQQGRDAILAAPQVQQKLDLLRQQALGQTTNEFQRKMLRDRFYNSGIVHMSQLGDFVGRQSFAWQKQVAAQRLDDARRDAGTDFAMPGMIKTIANGPEHIARFVAFANGLGKETPEADAFVEQYRTSIYHRAIAAAVAQGKHKIAIRLHNEIKDQLKGTDATLLGKIAEAARQALVAKDYTKQFVPPSPETATVEDIAEAQRIATDQNNGDWKDDDAQRATNQHDIDVKFGQAKQEAAKEQAAAEEAVNAWLDTPNTDGEPQTARPPLSLWVRLSPEEQRRVDDVLKDNAVAWPEVDHRNIMLAQAPINTTNGAGGAPAVEPPSNDPDLEREFQNWKGHVVYLPDGSTVADEDSPTGHMMSPFSDLRDVAREGRATKMRIGSGRLHGPGVPSLASVYERLRYYLAHGGAFDYQRRHYAFGKDHLTQLRQFRNVSNFNVGLFGQQAGISLTLLLLITMSYAAKTGSPVYRPDKPYGLDDRTREFIEKGYRAGESGIFNEPSPMTLNK